MAFDCEVCDALLEGGYPCDNCGFDPMDQGQSKRLAFDGGCETIDEFLEAALDRAEHPDVKRHIRGALQHRAAVRGDVGVDGTFSPSRRSS